MREIIDFHTHPYLRESDSICIYKAESTFSPEDLFNIGIKRFCGSVISHVGGDLECTVYSNETALKLKKMYTNIYIPGFMVHPELVDESINQLKIAEKNGVNLIGELVPYIYKWEYDHKGFHDILDYTRHKNFVYSLHTTSIDIMRDIALEYKDTVFVFAHPGEAERVADHIRVMKECENVYLDLSGTGLFRLGMLKHLISWVGADRILFGTDFPVCNPGMYISGVEFEKISDHDKDLIFAENAKRILSI